MIWRILFPFFEFWQRIERQLLVLLLSFDDWRDEFFKKILTQKFWPIVMYEVDQQALDVGAVLILISHDHDLSVP